MPYTYDEYDGLPWWRKFSENWKTAAAYIAIAVSVSLGFWAYDKSLDRTYEKANEVICGLKFFVSDLIEAGSNREAVLEKLDARLPAGINCVESDREGHRP
jgi:hypothetical protein